MNTETHQIIFEGSDRVEIFSFRPENIAKEKRGNFFLIGSIGSHLSKRDSSYYLLHSIAAIMKKEYYSSSYPQSNHAFENALKQANLFLSRVDRDVLDTLEIVVLNLSPNQLGFSVVGKPEILLVRDERLFRLLKSSPKTRASFNHITKGKIREQDKIVIGTSHLSSWLKRSSFISRLLKRSPDRLRDYLRQERLEAREQQTFALFQITVGQKPEKLPLVEHEVSFDPAKEVGAISPHPAPAQLSLPIVSPQISSPLKSLKRYYLKHWHAKIPLSSLGSNMSPALFSARQRVVSALRALPFSFPQLSLKPVLLILGFIFVMTALLLNLRSSEDVVQQAQTTIDPRTQGALLAFNALSESIQPSSAVFFNDSVFAVSRNTLYEVDLATKNAQPLLSLVGDIKALAHSEDMIFVLLKRDSAMWELVKFNTAARSIKKEDLAWPLETDFVKELKEYAQSIYVLEAFSGQIVRYSLADVAKSSLWLSASTREQIVNPVSLAVDGSIYLVLQGGSELAQLRLGTIAKTIPLPPGANVTHAITTSDLENLYLFDTTKAELLIVEKGSGKLLQSIHDEHIERMLDAEITENPQRIRIVNPSGIFTLNLP